MVTRTSNDKYARIDRQAKVSTKEKRRLNVECDELWSFVDNKGNKQARLVSNGQRN